jgi:hypothetical protein
MTSGCFGAVAHHALQPWANKRCFGFAKHLPLSKKMAKNRQSFGEQ